MANDESQTLMFSATYPQRRLQQLFQNDIFCHGNYSFITFGTISCANKNITQIVEKLDSAQKKFRLAEILNEDLANIDPINGKYYSKILVFVNRKTDIEYVMVVLESYGISKDKVFALKGNMLQETREQIIDGFKKGEFPVLIATSLVSRGLDILGVDHVINYDLPMAIEDYVHRIGRTGRAGNAGKATSFFNKLNRNDVKLAKFLVKIMADALQYVPPWLEVYGEGVSYVTAITRVLEGLRL